MVKLVATDEGDDYFLTPGQVAKTFGVTVKTISRWAKSGTLTPVVTPGGHRRYYRSEVERLLNGGGDDAA